MKRWFSYFVALVAQVAAVAQNGLSFSELMFQPRTGEPEWVELYNVSEVPVQLSAFALARVYGDSVGRLYDLPDYQVAPKSFVVLTKNREAVLAAYEVACAECLLQCSQLPSLPNAGASLALLSADSMIVERLDYKPSMHNKMLRNTAGVSIERKSYVRSVAEQSNWTSASAMVGYATPTGENSQHEADYESDFAIRLSSSIVCPNSDDADGVVDMVYENRHEGVMATVVVFDRQGRAVKKLVDNALLGTKGNFVWDGRDDAGIACATGSYIVVFALHDGFAWSKKIKKVVRVRF
ncbi:MAG: hypothetical protein IJ761_06640 [Bacteroidales bacterium]|nr:hypothetical protein [Bacteroidales bacterium]